MLSLGGSTIADNKSQSG